MGEAKDFSSLAALNIGTCRAPDSQIHSLYLRVLYLVVVYVVLAYQDKVGVSQLTRAAHRTIAHSQALTSPSRQNCRGFLPPVARLSRLDEPLH